MKWGMVGRADDRGLGHLAWETQRNLGPDRTLIIDMAELARGFPMHMDRFPADGLVARFEGGMLDETSCRDWLAGLDVVLMFETAYDWRFPKWAQEAGVATVLMAMPEFLPPQAASHHPEITAWWNPTSWRHRHLPGGARHVPVPVALDRFAPPGEREPGPLRVLHTAGHRAAHDRNGTLSVLMAARRVRRPMTITITGQADRLPTTPVPSRVDLRLVTGGHEHYWQPYAGHDVLVMPRRYGGLCLPVQEAMGAGLAVVMPDCAPNAETWPIVPIQSSPQGHIRCAAGDLPIITTSAQELGSLLDGFANDPGPLIDAQAASRKWAHDNSWDALRESWLAELASAALAGRRAR